MEKRSFLITLIASIVLGILLALGHLPSTLVTFGELTPILLFRCFLFNGCFGLFLGWLYRKYGILYAMMAHFLLHLVSKILLLLFI